MASDDRLSSIDLPRQFLDELLATAAGRPEIRRVLLFGSRARGDAAERSDIDLAIEAPQATRPQWVDLHLFLTEDAATLLEVDAVRLEDVDPVFRQRILAEGVVLYERR